MVDKRIVEFTMTVSFKLDLSDELTPEAVLSKFNEAIREKQKLLNNLPETRRRLNLLQRRAPEGLSVVDLWKVPISPKKKV